MVITGRVIALFIFAIISLFIIFIIGKKLFKMIQNFKAPAK